MYSKSHPYNNNNRVRMYVMYRGSGRMLAPPQVQPPFRQDSPPPSPYSPQERIKRFRRSNMHTISRGYLHIHRQGSSERLPTCPTETTCVAIGEVCDFFYNKARKCKHLLEEINRNRDPSLEPITENSPAHEFISTEPGNGKVNIVVEIGEPNEDLVAEDCCHSPENPDNI